MATTTPRLGLPRPEPQDLVTLANQQALIDAIDANAAKQSDAATALSTANSAKETAESHASRHAAGGADPLTPAEIGAASIGQVGNLPSLATTNKTNLVNAINEVFQSVSDGKNAIATAVTDMGQSATGSDTFAQLSSKIRSISNDANATASQVLSGRTFYQGGQKRTGSMTNRGNVSQTLTSQGQSYTVPSGYHSGSGTVTANISNLSAGNVRSGATVGGVAGTFSSFSNGATAAQILTGRSAAVNGSTVNGSMPNRSGHVTGQSISRTGTTLRIRPQSGYYDGTSGNSVQYSDANWIASNIREGKSIFGLTGTLREGAPFATGISTTNASNNIAVSGLGFQPQWVVIYARDITGAANAHTVIYSTHGDILGFSAGSFTTNALRARIVSGTAYVEDAASMLTISSSGFTYSTGSGVYAGSYRWFAGRWS